MFFGTICSALGYLALSFVSPTRALVDVGRAGWLMGARGFLFRCLCRVVHAIMAFLFGSIGHDLYWDGGHVRLRCRSRCRVSPSLMTSVGYRNGG